MTPTFKNTLAVILGLIIGSVVNMSIIMVSGFIIPPPVGADVTTVEGLKASMHLFKPINFLIPFLAHALGTFTGAIVIAKLTQIKQMMLGLILASFFFIGGLANVIMLPSPVWFTITDLGFAYFPMAYLGIKLIGKKI